MIELNFSKSYSAPSGAEVVLNFGALNGEDVITPVFILVTLMYRAPALGATARYDNNVSRPTVSSLGAQWERAEPYEHRTEALHQSPAKLRRQMDGLWSQGFKANTETSAEQSQLPPHHVTALARWQQALPTERHAAAAFAELLRSRRCARLRWDQALLLSASAQPQHVQLLPARLASRERWDIGSALYTLRASGFEHGIFISATRHVMPWQRARQPPTGRRSQVVPPPPPIPPYTPPRGNRVELNFRCPATGTITLDFGGGCAGAKRPTAREAYIIMNVISMIRVADGHEIQLLSANIDTDRASWCWSFSGSIAYSDLSKIQPSNGPVEVEVQINGVTWRFLIETYSESHEFAHNTISVTGRSPTVQLASPYAPTRSYTPAETLTSRQIADAELERPGLLSTFNLDWLLPDELGWSVPQNAWGYNNKTPMDVITEVASIGGFVSSHMTLRRLIVRPVTPFWEWGLMTPHAVIPRGLIMAQTLRWEERPLYNGVYVSGENAGVVALVRKLGTGGEYQAESIVHPLITDEIAARLKGREVLSAGGKQATVTLELPIETSLGVLQPGQLIEVDNVGSSEPSWRGLVNSVSINATWATVRQHVECVRHYGGFE